MPARSRLWMVLAVGAVALAMIGVRPEEETKWEPVPPETYPIAADAEAERTHASANFTVTWIEEPGNPATPALRDKDGSGAPDSIEILLGAFESARGFLVGELGYRPPPTTGPMRVYVMAGDRAETKLAPGGSGTSRPSFILMPASILRPVQRPRELRAVAVHEYFHAIQNGYQPQHDPWIAEASSAWVEDVYDDGLDLNHSYLAEFVPSPRVGLTDLGGAREYGAFLFLQFLVERFADGDPSLVRELWQRMATTDSITAIQQTVSQRGATLASAWAEFLLWRWDLERFVEGAAYQQALGNAWPEPLQSTEVRNESCRLSSDEGSGLPPLSGDYSVFRPADRPDSGRATVTIEGPPGAAAFVLVEKPNGKERSRVVPIGEDGLATSQVRFGDDVVKRVVLGVGNTAVDGPPASIGYSLRIVGRGAVTAEATAPPEDTHFFGGLGLRGRVLCNGQPAPSADLVLVQRARSGEERSFALTAGPTGTWSVNLQPEETSTYQVTVVDPLLSDASSSLWEVGVRVAVRLEVPDSEVALGEPVSVEGEVTPVHAGAPVVIEYRRPELSWRGGPQTSVGADGSFGTSLMLPGPGIWHLRATVMSTGDDDHLPNSTINDVFVDVRG